MAAGLHGVPGTEGHIGDLDMPACTRSLRKVVNEAGFALTLALLSINPHPDRNHVAGLLRHHLAEHMLVPLIKHPIPGDA